MIDNAGFTSILVANAAWRILQEAPHYDFVLLLLAILIEGWQFEWDTNIFVIPSILAVIKKHCEMEGSWFWQWWIRLCCDNPSIPRCIFMNGVSVDFLRLGYLFYFMFHRSGNDTQDVTNYLILQSARFLQLQYLHSFAKNFYSRTTAIIEREAFAQRRLMIMYQLRCLPIQDFPQHAGDEINACCICQEDYKPGEILRILPQCGHDFHLICFDPWAYTFLRKPTWPSCPLCNSSMEDAMI